jgi:hypothetical protein
VATPDKQLTDPEEGLIRRVMKSKDRARRKFKDRDGTWRVPALTLELRPAEGRFMSVNLQSSLLAAGCPLSFVPSDFPGNQNAVLFVRFTVGLCSELGLPVFHQPRPPHNPHHGGVGRLYELRNSDPAQYENALNAIARQAAVISDD